MLLKTLKHFPVVPVLPWFLLGQLVIFSRASADGRPSMPVIRVREEGIKLDGKFNEWPAEAFAPTYERSADDKSQLNFLRRPEGEWTGKQDASCVVRAASDPRNLYLAATVRDQLLFNDSTPENPWMGDDFEVFIDANPAPSRYGKGINENVAQFIFVPDRVMPATMGTVVWRAEKFPTVQAATRLTPLGYDLEIQIPKNVLPYWRDHPDMEAVGFDVCIGDLDTPGIVGHDAAPKCVLFLLSPFAHFQSAAQLGELRFDRERTSSTRLGKVEPPALPGYDNAQSLLDAWEQPNVGVAVNLALNHANLARKAALFMLTKRNDIDFDIDQVAAILDEASDDSDRGRLLDCRVYAMVALAQRHRLPSVQLVNRFGSSNDASLRQTILYCAGINGDKAAVPALKALYPASDGRVREFLAISLARLGDGTGAGDLQSYVKRDQGQPFGLLCAALLKELASPVP